jgi:hypothetical protein
MKKFIVSVLAALAVTPSMAHHGVPHRSEPWHAINSPQFYQRHHHHKHGWGWTVPILLGGVIIGYEWSRSQQPIIVQQPQVTVLPPPVNVNTQTEVCSDWREVQTSDGLVYRERTCRSN